MDQQPLGITTPADHVDIVVARVKEYDRPRLNRSKQACFIIIRTEAIIDLLDDSILVMCDLVTIEYSDGLTSVEQGHYGRRRGQTEYVAWIGYFTVDPKLGGARS